MPSDAPANGPDWSVRTPSVIVSSVTPGPVSTTAGAPLVGAAASVAAGAGAVSDGDGSAEAVEGSSDLLEQALAERDDGGQRERESG